MIIFWRKKIMRFAQSGGSPEFHCRKLVMETEPVRWAAASRGQITAVSLLQLHQVTAAGDQRQRRDQERSGGSAIVPAMGPMLAVIRRTQPPPPAQGYWRPAEAGAGLPADAEAGCCCWCAGLGRASNEPSRILKLYKPRRRPLLSHLRIYEDTLLTNVPVPFDLCHLPAPWLLIIQLQTSRRFVWSSIAVLAWPLPWPGPIPLLTASAVLDARRGRCRGRGCEDALFAEVAARDCKIVSALFCTDGITSCCFPQHNDTGGTRSLGNLHCVHGRGYFPVAFKLPSSARS